MTRGNGCRHEAGCDPGCVRVAVREEIDVVVARRCVRELGRELRLADSAVESLATAVSEIARNIVVHAGAGELVLGVVRAGARRGILVVARDDGPGIADIDRAMEDGYTTSDGLGLGLASARRLVDDFDLASNPAAGAGTTVTMKQWSS